MGNRLETKLHLRSGSTARSRCHRAGTKLDWCGAGTELDGSGAGAGGYRPWGARCRARTSIGRSGSSLNSSRLFRYTCRSWRSTKECGSLGLGLEIGIKDGEGNRSGLWSGLLRSKAWAWSWGSCCGSRSLSKSWWRTGRLAKRLSTKSGRRTGLGLSCNGESSCGESTSILASIGGKSTRLSNGRSGLCRSGTCGSDRTGRSDSGEGLEEKAS